MSSEPIRTSRLARYSLVATAAAATGMADLTVLADVTSGSLSISFGRTSGTNFFNGFDSVDSSSSVGNAGVTDAPMGDLYLGLSAFLYGSFADASFTMSIANSGSADAHFVQRETVLATGSGSTNLDFAQQVSAGQVWNGNSASTTSILQNEIFFTYSDSSSNFHTWTNPDANGTKYINFLIEDGGAFTYGWIQLDWNITDSNDWSVSISNWAYTSDGPLAAGDTAGSQAVPGLGGLAALAIGAAGVRGRRQRVAG